MSNTFDRCLETLQLMSAAEEYALRRGPAKSLAYRAAWLEFRQHIRTLDDRPGWGPAPWAVSADAISVLNAAVERAVLIDGASMANAQLLDPSAGALRIVAHTGFSTEFLEFFDAVEDTSSACGSALAAGHAVWVPDATQSSIFAGTPALDVLLDAQVRAVASVPVLSEDGRPIGMISTHHSRVTRWTDERKLALHVVARAAGRLLDYLAPVPSADQRKLSPPPEARISSVARAFAPGSSSSVRRRANARAGDQPS